jgi:DNA-3-methyladenine glycosylase
VRGVPRPSGKLLTAEFFERDTLEVTRDLCGKLLVRELDGEVRYGRLVELEAYLGPEDQAAHSSRGLTPRTSVMYGPPGHAYVYLIYGQYNCLNFVTRPTGIPQAILVRALEPGPRVGRCSGPGLLTQALEIDRTLNGRLLAPPDLYVIDDGWQPADIIQTKRIGVDYSGSPWNDEPWRFCVPGPHLSRRLPAPKKVGPDRLQKRARGA